MIILATHKRRASMERFIRAYRATDATEPVKLVIDKDDESYHGMFLPRPFSVLRIPAGAVASERANMVYRHFPNEPYYAILGDDIVPLTKEWDVKMKEACGAWKMAYCADGIQNERLPTHPFIGGEYVRAQGFIEEPSLHDAYADPARKDVAYALGLAVYVEDVKFDHLHWSKGKSEHDDTYKKQWDHNEDAYLYQQWLNFGGFRKTCERMKAAMDKAGVKAA